MTNINDHDQCGIFPTSNLSNVLFSPMLCTAWLPIYALVFLQNSILICNQHVFMVCLKFSWMLTECFITIFYFPRWMEYTLVLLLTSALWRHLVKYVITSFLHITLLNHDFT